MSSSLLSKNIKVNTYRIMPLPVVLYGSEVWSLTLREEHSLRVFEHRVLRRIFGPKTEEITGEWRKLHKEELHHLYYLPNRSGPPCPRIQYPRFQLSAVYRFPKKIWKIKEINVSYVSKSAPSENGP